MPTYEYRCDTCDRTFDVVQSFEDEPLTRCPTCDAPVRKVFGSVGIVFKGSGFYKTDSRNGSGSSKSGDQSAASGESANSGDRSEKGPTSEGSNGASEAAKPTTPSDSKSKPERGSGGGGDASRPAANAS